MRVITIYSVTEYVRFKTGVRNLTKETYLLALCMESCILQ